MTHPTLFDCGVQPRARRTDPDTSHLAAASMRASAADHRDLIVRVLSEHHRPMSAEQIAARIGLTHVQVNRRMAELREAHLVVRCDERVPTATGRSARTYQVTR